MAYSVSNRCRTRTPGSSRTPAPSSGNGPKGKFEVEAFAAGTRVGAQALADSNAVTAGGGGEPAEDVEKFGLADKVCRVSTDGGAFLKSLEGKTFKSLKVIPDR